MAVAAATPLDTYVRSGWIDGLLESSVEPITINGMVGITATARAGEWNFRLAVIRYDTGDVYRMIFATHGLDEAHEKAFRSAINTFRKIDPAEADKVKALRIQLDTARSGDTAFTEAKKMVVPDKPLETFELLNGLETDTALKPGERYKLVAE